MGSSFTNFVISSSTTSPVQLGVFGGRGRLGSAIQQAAMNVDGCVLTVIGRGDSDPVATDSLDVLINATTAADSIRSIKNALKLGIPVVECATGHDDEMLRELENAAQVIPVLVAPNTSLGVAVVRQLLETAGPLLRDWDVEIIETHHEKKKDQPSGTATFFSKILNRVRGKSIPGEMVKSIREGDVVGEHVIQFTGEQEVIRIEHRSLDRVLFGFGAIRAASWLIGRNPGMYTIQDTLQD